MNRRQFLKAACSVSAGIVVAPYIKIEVLDKLILPSQQIVNVAGAPLGWLPCDGRVLNKWKYPELFATICDVDRHYNTDGRLPDIEGKSYMGLDDRKPVEPKGLTPVFAIKAEPNVGPRGPIGTIGKFWV